MKQLKFNPDKDMKEYKVFCANCNKELIFNEEEHQEMKKEYKELYGMEINDIPTSIVCDDCFKKMNNEYPIEDFLDDFNNGNL